MEERLPRVPNRIRLHNIHNRAAIQLGNWLEKRPMIEFTLDQAVEAVGYSADNRHHRTMVYNVLNYWRKKSKEVWDYYIQTGILKPKTFAENWGLFLYKFNRDYRAFYILYDTKDKVYYQPKFSAKEILDQKRAERKIKALTTVLKEMAGFDEHLLVTGQSIREALQEADRFAKKYITNHRYELEQK